jgi:hypothetical protein
MRWKDYRQTDIHRAIDRVEMRIMEALLCLDIKERLAEVDISDKLGPDPEAVELDRIDKSIEQGKRRKHQVKLKGLLAQVQKTRAAALGQKSPVPPQSPVPPPKKPKF